MRVLKRGFKGFNQVKVRVGLQVFYNLGELKAIVNGMINKYKNHI